MTFLSKVPGSKIKPLTPEEVKTAQESNFTSFTPSKPCGNQIAWRYFGLDTLLRYKKDNRWYFPAANRFEDAWEMTCVEHQQRRIDLNKTNDNKTSDGNYPINHLIDSMNRKYKVAEIQRKWGVSCWFLSDIENALMWSSYAKSKTGLAIGITVNNVASLIQNMQDVSYGMVSYHEIQTDVRLHCLPEKYVPFIKRSEFSSEQELRFAVSLGKEEQGYGKHINVNIAESIEFVRVSDKKTYDEASGIFPNANIEPSTTIGPAWAEPAKNFFDALSKT